VIKSDVIKKAELLAAAIAQSSERANLIRLEEEIIANESAQQLMVKWQEAHDLIMEKEQNRIELTKAEQFEFMRIQNGIQDNPLIVSYMTAQDKFEEMLQSVNDILSGAISGSFDSCSCDDDSCQSSGCSSCN
jgi:cell fate (sporulation/competence/biofilm development) regulator YlbF (YheA/YmcA/DUF963 family)